MTTPIGIDLGTTNSCVAYVQSDTGNPVIIPDSQGQPLLPSIFAQTSEGQFLVGYRAKNCKNPLFRHAFVKRSMGTNDEFPINDGVTKSAASISSEFLRELKNRAETKLGDSVAAVITVPAHFPQNAIEQTRSAAHEAGLGIIDIIREPVAAAMAYFHEKLIDKSNAKLLVYDLGGGTMDATVCIRQGSDIRVGAGGKAYDGNPTLGGVDFDKALVKLAIAEIKKQGVAVTDGLLTQQVVKEGWVFNLLLSAEKVKKALSDEPNEQWLAEFSIQGQDVPLNLWIERQEFEAVIKNDIQKTLECCDSALRADADECLEFKHLDPTERLRREISSLDAVILVGGSSRIPYVKFAIREHYKTLAGVDIPIQIYKVDECVALGAALYANFAHKHAPEEKGKGVIDWFGEVPSQVGEEFSELYPLTGKVILCDGQGWTINIAYNSNELRVNCNQDGIFTIPKLTLRKGNNPIELTIFDANGNIQGEYHNNIVRGGLSADPGGLARPIQIRLVDGVEAILQQGEKPGCVQQKVFYINEECGKIYAPLYEGHIPIGSINIELEVPLPVGHPVIFKTCYKPGELDIDVQLQDQDTRRFSQPFSLVKTNNNKDSLVAYFEQLKSEFQQISNEDIVFGRLGINNPYKERYEYLVLDILGDMESPIFDPVRIQDRLAQLQQLLFAIKALSDSADGIKIRVEILHGFLVNIIKDSSDESSLDILNRLEEIKEIASHANLDPQTLKTLSSRLDNISNQIRMRSKIPVTISEVNELYWFIAQRIDTIIKYSGYNDNVNIIEQTSKELISRIDSTNAAMIFNRLWKLNEEINPLYYKALKLKGNQGLLTKTPK